MLTFCCVGQLSLSRTARRKIKVGWLTLKDRTWQSLDGSTLLDPSECEGDLDLIKVLGSKGASTNEHLRFTSKLSEERSTAPSTRQNVHALCGKTQGQFIQGDRTSRKFSQSLRFSQAVAPQSSISSIIENDTHSSECCCRPMANEQSLVDAKCKVSCSFAICYYMMQSLPAF